MMTTTEECCQILLYIFLCSVVKELSSHRNKVLGLIPGSGRLHVLPVCVWVLQVPPAPPTAQQHANWGSLGELGTCPGYRLMLTLKDASTILIIQWWDGKKSSTAS